MTDDIGSPGPYFDLVRELNGYEVRFSWPGTISALLPGWGPEGEVGAVKRLEHTDPLFLIEGHFVFSKNYTKERMINHLKDLISRLEGK